MGWWITLGILFLLAILPLGVSVRYDADGVRVRVVCGFIRLTVVPLPKWLKKKPKPQNQAQEKPKEEKKKKPQPPPPPEDPQPKKKGGSIMDFLPLVEVGLDFLGAFRRKLRLDYLQLRIVMAGGDPCDLAVNYGKAWAALGNLLPQLERVFVIKKRDLEVECDFTSAQTLITAGLDITITLGRLIGLAVVYGIRVLIVFLKIKKNKKAVQQNESEAS